MYNRKFNVKKDFSALNELENEIMPIVGRIRDKKEQERLREYIRNTFNNQWKK